MFITTTLWLSQYGYDSALGGFDASLRRLGLDHVDLYLLHWPLPSDFEPKRLRALMERSEVVPAVNQVELHPFFMQGELRQTHQRLGIVTQAYSPLGNTVRRTGTADPLTHKAIVALATKYRKTPARIVLRWHVQHGCSAIPKSFRPERIAGNFDIFAFTLDAADMAAIDALDTGKRFGFDPEVMTASALAISLDD